MRGFSMVAVLATVIVFTSSPFSRADGDDYNADDCAELAGTLNMHWRAIAGPNAPCTAIVSTDVTLEDAADGNISFFGTESTDPGCMNPSHYDLYMSDQHLSLAGFDTTNQVPMFLGLSNDGKCYFGRWLVGAQDYVVHISADAFENATPAICGDVNSSASINTSDALLVLKKGVGQDIVLTCGANNDLETCIAQLTTCTNRLTDANATILESQQFQCGDGSINLPGEHCDVDDFGGTTCASLIAGTHGTLGCDENCHFDTSACLPCEGALIGGLCWFQGDWGQSCTEVCEGHGLTYDTKTNQYIPENISGALRCEEVTAALPLPSDEKDCGFYYNALWGGGPAYADNCGCVSDRGSCLDFDGDINRSFLDVSGTTTADAKNTAVARVCACRP